MWNANSESGQLSAGAVGDRFTPTAAATSRRLGIVDPTTVGAAFSTTGLPFCAGSWTPG